MAMTQEAFNAYAEQITKVCPQSLWELRRASQSLLPGLPTKLYLVVRNVPAPAIMTEGGTLTAHVALSDEYSSPQLFFSLVDRSGAPVNLLPPSFFSAQQRPAPSLRAEGEEPTADDVFVAEALAAQATTSFHPITGEMVFALHACSNAEAIMSIIPPGACEGSKPTDVEGSSGCSCFGCNVVRWFIVAFAPPLGVDVSPLR